MNNKNEKSARFGAFAHRKIAANRYIFGALCIFLYSVLTGCGGEPREARYVFNIPQPVVTRAMDKLPDQKSDSIGDWGEPDQLDACLRVTCLDDFSFVIDAPRAIMIGDRREQKLIISNALVPEAAFITAQATLDNTAVYVALEPGKSPGLLQLTIRPPYIVGNKQLTLPAIATVTVVRKRIVPWVESLASYTQSHPVQPWTQTKEELTPKTAVSKTPVTNSAPASRSGRAVPRDESP